MAVAPRTAYARSGDVRIAYQVVGETSADSDVVWLPGFVSNVDLQWELAPWARTFERLASFSRLILWDKRGTGCSDPVDRVTRLVLCGTSPRARYADDWPSGWTAERLDGWLTELDRKWGDDALLEVFALSVAGTENAVQAWGRYLRAGASPAMGRAVLEAAARIDCRRSFRPSTFRRWSCTAAAIASSTSRAPGSWRMRSARRRSWNSPARTTCSRSAIRGRTSTRSNGSSPVPWEWLTPHVLAGAAPLVALSDAGRGRVLAEERCSAPVRCRGEWFS